MPIKDNLRASIERCDGQAFLTALAELAPTDHPAPACPAPVIRHLVLQGGGAKGAAYPGLIQALEEQCILQQIETFVGSSAGAISAFILALGFNAKEFADLVGKHNLQDLMDFIDTQESILPDGVAQIKSALGNGFAFSGDNALNFFEMLCQEMLGDPYATFIDLEREKQTNPKLKSLMVTATLVENGAYIRTEPHGSWIFSSQHHSEARIADVIRASMSIPGVYRNHAIRNKAGVVLGYFSDGGIYNNCAVQVLDTETYLDPNYRLNDGINHSTLCATLVSKVDLNLTNVPVPQALQHTVNTSSASMNAMAEPTPVNENSLWQAVVLGLKKGLKIGHVVTKEHEDLTAKTERHKTRIVQIQNAQVSPVEFDTPKKALLFSHGYTAGMNTLRMHLNPEQPYQGLRTLDAHQLTARRPDVIFNLVQEFVTELNKYKDTPISDQYAPNNIEKNVRLIYLTHQLRYCVKVTEQELTAAFTSRSLIPTLAEPIQTRYQAVNDDDIIIRKLYMLLTAPDYHDEYFKRYLNGQFSRGMQLLVKPIAVDGGLNLLQSAVKIRNTQAVATILQYVHKNCKQLVQQSRLVTDYRHLIYDAQPSLLTLAIQQNHLEMVQLLLEHDADPLSSAPDGNSPLHIALAASEGGPNAIVKALIESLRKKNRLVELSTTPFGQDGNTILHELFLKDQYNERVTSIVSSIFSLERIADLINKEIHNAAGISIFECFSTNQDLWEALQKSLPQTTSGMWSWFWRGPVATKLNKNDALASVRQKQSVYQQKCKEATDRYNELVKEERIDRGKLKEKTQEELASLFGRSQTSNILHVAITLNDIESVKLICQKLSEKDAIYALTSTAKVYIDQKYQERSALYLASELGYTDIVEYFRSLDAAVEKTGPEECPSAMTIAARNGHYRVVRSLIASKPQAINTTAEKITRSMKDAKGLSAIHYVAKNGNADDIFTILFDNKHSASAVMSQDRQYGRQKDSQGFTALDHMVRRADAANLLKRLIQLCGFDSIDSKKQNLFFSTFDVDVPQHHQYLSTFEYVLLYHYPVAQMMNQCRQSPLPESQLLQKRNELMEYRADIARTLPNSSSLVISANGDVPAGDAAQQKQIDLLQQNNARLVDQLRQLQWDNATLVDRFQQEEATQTHRSQELQTALESISQQMTELQQHIRRLESANQALVSEQGAYGQKSEEDKRQREQLLQEKARLEAEATQLKDQLTRLQEGIRLTELNHCEQILARINKRIVDANDLQTRLSQQEEAMRGRYNDQNHLVLRKIPHLCFGLGLGGIIAAGLLFKILFMPAIILAAVASTLIFGAIIVKVCAKPTILSATTPIVGSQSLELLTSNDLTFRTTPLPTRPSPPSSPRSPVHSFGVFPRAVDDNVNDNRPPPPHLTASI